MDVRRGDIWYIDNDTSYGSEQSGKRPAIIVSNDYGNVHAPIVEIVWLTSQPKKPLPTHVQLGKETALCEQICTVDKSRLLTLKRMCTDREMMKINKAMMISLGIIE